MLSSWTRFLTGALLVVGYASAAVLHFGEPLNARGVSRRAPGEVITKCTVPGTVALTFDDGPFVYLNEIVDALTSAGANGTFFFNTWEQFEENAARVKYAYENGHQIASHTWGHRHLNTLSQHDVHVEFWLVEEAMYKITGAYTAFTRPPFGEYNDQVREVARMRGMTIANWDFDSRDTAGFSGPQSVAEYRTLIASHPETILALNHEITRSTAQIIPEVVRELQGAGYRLTTLADCLGVDPYQFVDEPQARDETWRC